MYGVATSPSSDPMTTRWPAPVRRKASIAARHTAMVSNTLVVTTSVITSGGTSSMFPYATTAAECTTASPRPNSSAACATTRCTASASRTSSSSTDAAPPALVALLGEQPEHVRGPAGEHHVEALAREPERRGPTDAAGRPVIRAAVGRSVVVRIRVPSRRGVCLPPETVAYPAAHQPNPPSRVHGPRWPGVGERHEPRSEVAQVLEVVEVRHVLEGG